MAGVIRTLIPDPLPERQPIMEGTWTGRWEGIPERLVAGETPTIGRENTTIIGGNATISVKIAENGTTVDLNYGNFSADFIPSKVDSGRFRIVTADGAYAGKGQFGGPSTRGVVGHVDGEKFHSVFYGER